MRAKQLIKRTRNKEEVKMRMVREEIEKAMKNFEQSEEESFQRFHISTTPSYCILQDTTERTGAAHVFKASVIP